MSSGKQIRITLFHANWCGHCTRFMPTWETMKADKDSKKIIDFQDHEESSIGNLDESVRTIDGKDVRSFGYPSIKINVNDKEYVYEGQRTVDDIYGSILEELKKMSGVNGTLTVTKSDKNIDISTSEDDAGNFQSETSIVDESMIDDLMMLTNTEKDDRPERHQDGGKRSGSNKSIFAKRLTKNDFKSFLNSATLSVPEKRKFK
jgi:hypothetical protein